MVLCWLLGLGALAVAAHLLLSRWMRADRARVATRHRAAAEAAAPGLQTPEPDDDEDRQAEPLKRLLGAIAEDERRADGRRQAD